MRFVRLGLIVAGLVATGCSPAVGGASLLAAGMLFLGLGITGHLLSTGCGARAAAGTWERCCVDGRIATCYCPPNNVFNYGLGVEFRPDGTCSRTSAADAGVAPPVDAGSATPDGGLGDAGIADAGVEEDAGVPEDAGMPEDGGAACCDTSGTWEACCVEGRTSFCHCPPSMACNYGQAVTFCPDGTCIPSPGATCPELDGGPYDPAGSWQLCCSDGQVSACYCPPNVACNYGQAAPFCASGACYSSAPPTCDGGA